jgi:hypothetical protein
MPGCLLCWIKKSPKKTPRFLVYTAVQYSAVLYDIRLLVRTNLWQLASGLWSVQGVMTTPKSSLTMCLVDDAFWTMRHPAAESAEDCHTLDDVSLTGVCAW